MKVLVLWARMGTTNYGVQALAAGTTELVRAAFPDADIRTHGTGGPGAEGNDGPSNLLRPTSLMRDLTRRPSAFGEWLRTFDFVMDTRAGDSFADIYGVPQLGRMTIATQIAHQLKVPVVMSPQTVGPFDTARGRMLARRSLKTATVVMTRDSRSEVVARQLGREADLVASDVVFALPVPQHVEKVRDVILNPSGLLWSDNPHVDAARYRDTIVRLVHRLLDEGRQVSLLGHVVHPNAKPGDNDTHALEELRRLMDAGCEILLPGSVWEVRELIASGEVLIGSRMHACLNAISMGVPAIPLAYSDKFSPLLSDLGLSDVTVDARQDRDLVEPVMSRLAQNGLAAKAAGAAHEARTKLESASRQLAARFG